MTSTMHALVDAASDANNHKTLQDTIGIIASSDSTIFAQTTCTTCPGLISRFLFCRIPFLELCWQVNISPILSLQYLVQFPACFILFLAALLRGYGDYIQQTMTKTMQFWHPDIICWHLIPLSCILIGPFHLIRKFDLPYLNLPLSSLAEGRHRDTIFWCYLRSEFARASDMAAAYTVLENSTNLI